MEEKELVKQSTDIVSLIGQTVNLKRAGSNYKGLCPFHQEKTPSFMVNPELGIYKCFGCGESGDVFSWLMKTEGMSFYESLKTLADRAGIKLTSHRPDKQDRLRQELMEITRQAAEFYHFLLRKHAKAQAARQYLKNRQISSQTIATFGLGWAPDSWQSLFTVLTQKGFQPEQLQAAGLVVRHASGRWYDRFRNRIVYPLTNHRGQIVGLSGRTLSDDKQVPKYINTPETAIYHKRELLFGLSYVKQEIRRAGRVIVCEGEMDMLSSYQAGVKETVAIKGTALTEFQINLIKRYAEQIVLALDMDLAGDAAARKGVQLASRAGLDVRVVRLPPGKDPDDVARQDPKLWQQLVSQSVEVYQFWLDSAVDRWGLDSGYAKAKIVADMAQLLSGVDNQVLVSHWVGQTAGRLGIEAEAVWQQMRKGRGAFAPRPPTVKQDKPDETPSHPRLFQLEDRLVGWCFSQQPDKLLQPEMRQWLSQNWIKRLIAWLESHQPLPADWQTQLPEELRQKLAESLMLVEDTQSNWGRYKQDIDQLLLHEIQQIKLRQQLKQLGQEIAQLEQASAGSDKLLALQKQFSQLSKQLSWLEKKSV